jgi:hypothetical protein
MDELVAGIAEGLDTFNALDLDGVMNDLRDVLSSAKDQVAALNMGEINDNVITITEDIQRITGDEKLAGAVEKLDLALAEINELAAGHLSRAQALVARMTPEPEAPVPDAVVPEPETALPEIPNPGGAE